MPKIEEVVVTDREKELMSQLEAANRRADKAESNAVETDLKLKDALKTPFREDEPHVRVFKDGEELMVHPSTVKAHTEAGWRVKG